MTTIRQAIQLPDVLQYAHANQGRIHAVVRATVQGAPDQAFLLTHPEGIQAEDLPLALKAALVTITGPGAALEVPEFVQMLAERVEAFTARLEGILPIGARPAAEAEADALGRALGAALARTYLEQRRGE